MFEVLLTYNNKNVHTATDLTPDQAKLDKYRLQVLLLDKKGEGLAVSSHPLPFEVINTARLRLFIV